MKTIIKNTVCLTLLLCCQYTLVAENKFSENHCRLARKFLEETGAQLSHENGLAEGVEMQMQAAPQMAAFRVELEKWQSAYLSWEHFEEDYVQIICSAYSEEEIESLIEFFNTPIGRKHLEKSDEIAIEAIRLSQQKAARHQPELSILFRKRAEELEMEVENLFPEYKTDDGESGDKSHFIYESTHFIGGDMQTLVYPLSQNDIESRSSFDPREASLPLSPIEGMDIAFSEYYKDLGVNVEEYWDDTRISLINFTIDSDDAESPGSSSIWFYTVHCSVFGSYPAFGTPADVVVLLDGTVIDPQKKKQG